LAGGQFGLGINYQDLNINKNARKKEKFRITISSLLVIFGSAHDSNGFRHHQLVRTVGV
jgi:hypothetical protein